jgi:hypothetical protein
MMYGASRMSPNQFQPDDADTLAQTLTDTSIRNEESVSKNEWISDDSAEIVGTLSDEDELPTPENDVPLYSARHYSRPSPPLSATSKSAPDSSFSFASTSETTPLLETPRPANLYSVLAQPGLDQADVSLLLEQCLEPGKFFLLRNQVKFFAQLFPNQQDRISTQIAKLFWSRR